MLADPRGVAGIGVVTSESEVCVRIPGVELERTGVARPGTLSLAAHVGLEPLDGQAQ